MSVPLTPAERAVLSRVLSADFPGVQGLRRQVDSAQATRRWAAGSPSMDLVVPGDTAPAQVADGPIPAAAHVYNGDEYVGEILLWVREGRLSALEYSWVTDEPPAALPPADWIKLA